MNAIGSTMIEQAVKESQEIIMTPSDTSKMTPSSTPRRSMDINQISEALSKAQGMYKRLEPNTPSPRGSYANLQAILSAVKEGLSSNGLAFYQGTVLTEQGSGAKMIESILSHASGQWISSVERVVPGKTWRSTGNIYEVVKRIQASMLLGIAPSDNDPILFDDDGEEQAQIQLIDDLKVPETMKKHIDRQEPVTNEQYHKLMAMMDGYSDIAKSVLEKYQLETLADLPKSEFYLVEAGIQRVKNNNQQYLDRLRKQK